MSRRWTVSLSWGPNGGFYCHSGRLCLWKLAFTVLPGIEIDDLMKMAADSLPPKTAAPKVTFRPTCAAFVSADNSITGMNHACALPPGHQDLHMDTQGWCWSPS